MSEVKGLLVAAYPQITLSHLAMIDSGAPLHNNRGPCESASVTTDILFRSRENSNVAIRGDNVS